MLTNNDGRTSVSCDDCYFRQELLCALKTKVPCPTFRATVGRARRSGPTTMAVPVQAPLIPIPTMAADFGQPQALPAATARMPRAAAGFEDGEGHPFDSGSNEATFMLRDAQAEVPPVTEDAVPVPAVCMPPPREEVFAQGSMPMRSVAAGRNRGTSLLVEVAERPHGQLEVADAETAPSASNRTSRIALRVASRYPGASPS